MEYRYHKTEKSDKTNEVSQVFLCDVMVGKYDYGNKSLEDDNFFPRKAQDIENGMY